MVFAGLVTQGSPLPPRVRLPAVLVRAAWRERGLLRGPQRVASARQGSGRVRRKPRAVVHANRVRLGNGPLRPAPTQTAKMFANLVLLASGPQPKPKFARTVTWELGLSEPARPATLLVRHARRVGCGRRLQRRIFRSSSSRRRGSIE